MKKFLYCDSCFLITFYQYNNLESLAQYKDQFFISETQISEELKEPNELPIMVRRFVTVISEDRTEILEKTDEFASLYSSLSIFDCLCMAYSKLDGYCLITDDKALQKKCALNNIEVKTSNDIVNEFLKGGDDDENVKY